MNTGPQVSNYQYPSEINCKKTYNILTKYPIPRDPIRYPFNTDPAIGYRSNFHDLLLANMTALVPNIDIGYHTRDHSADDLKQWIQTTKDYMYILNRNIRKKCEVQLKKLTNIENQKQKSRELNMVLVQNLPDDIIRHIHGFLLPETRIELFLAKYPLYAKAIEKITSQNLKKYVVHIYKTYYEMVFNYNGQIPERRSCLQRHPKYLISYSNKRQAVDQITILFDLMRDAIPRTPVYHRYFQTHALKILKSMIYVGIYRGEQLKRNRKPTATL
jgi:hypothetical protein